VIQFLAFLILRKTIINVLTEVSEVKPAPPSIHYFVSDDLSAWCLHNDNQPHHQCQSQWVVLGVMNPKDSGFRAENEVGNQTVA